MKKNFAFFFCMLGALALPVLFTSCGDDDDDDDTSPYAEAIIGTWTITHIQLSSGWVDLSSSSIYQKYQSTATFYSDGTYYGSGYLGTGTATYKLSGDTIITYVDGEEYVRYKILSLVDGVAEMIMTMGDTSLTVRATKQ